jgi:hypothetical protein
MTQQTLTGAVDLRIPSVHRIVMPPLSAAFGTLDATGEAIYMVGTCFLPARSGSKTISSGGGGKIGWLAGTATFGDAGTELRIGVQDLHAGTGEEMVGADDTPDVYAILIGGTDTITTNTWHTTTMETGTKTIAHGDKIAISFNMVSRVSPDSVLIRGIASTAQVFPGVTQQVAGPAYSAVGMLPNAIIEFDDGTFGWIDGSFITSTGATFTNTSIQVGSAGADEFGTIFRVPYPCQVDALYAVTGPTVAASDYELILYSDPLGTPAVIEAITVIGDHAQVTSARYGEYPLTTIRSLTANTDYLVSVRPTTANVVSITTIDVAAAGHMVSHPYGTDSNIAKRIDNAGAFTETTTQRMFSGVRICALGDDAGGGGGGGGLTLVGTGGLVS